MKKIKKIATLAKKARIKIRNRDFVYKNKGLREWGKSATRYHRKYGTRKTAKRLTQEVRRAARHSHEGMQLSFPNGIKSGFDINHMKSWYKHNAQHLVIVIPSYNDYDVLKPCLESLWRTTSTANVSILVVDDFCTKESHNALSGFEREGTEVIYRNVNGGFAKAVNTGMKHATKKYPKSDILLLNSDTTAHDNWLEALQYAAYNYHKKVGIVGPKLLYPDGSIQSAGSHRNTEHPEWFDHYYRFKPANYGPACVPQYCIGVTGASMYIKNSTVKQVGYMDEKFQFAFEDMDYCLRAWNLGIRSLYFPESVMTHHESVSRAKHTTLKPKERASVTYFWQKWSDWFDNRNVRNENGDIRIIYVLQSTGVSGGHKIAFQHLDNLLDKGYDVELWALDKAPTWFTLRTPTKTFKNYETLTRSLEKVEAIKVATWWETAAPIWLSSVNKGIPAFVIHEVETAFYPNNPEIQSSVASSYRKEFNNIISCSYTLQGIRELSLDGTLLPCGYSDDIFKVLQDVVRDEDTVMAIARSFFQKNFKQTFNAWRSIKTNQPKLSLFGSEPGLVKKDKNISFEFKPTDSEVNKLYNQATVFVQTSYHEGFGLPILEAMASGCPVICTDAHGNRDFCFDDKNCLIVEKDDVAGLAETITRVIEDKALQKRLREAGLKTAKKYTWGAVANQLDSFYKGLEKQPNKDYLTKVLKSYEG